MCCRQPQGVAAGLIQRRREHLCKPPRRQRSLLVGMHRMQHPPDQRVHATAQGIKRLFLLLAQQLAERHQPAMAAAWARASRPPCMPPLPSPGSSPASEAGREAMPVAWVDDIAGWGLRCVPGRRRRWRELAGGSGRAKGQPPWTARRGGGVEGVRSSPAHAPARLDWRSPRLGQLTSGGASDRLL